MNFSQDRRNARTTLTLACGCKYPYNKLKKGKKHKHSYLFICETHGKQKIENIEYSCIKCGCKVTVKKIKDVRLTCTSCRSGYCKRDKRISAESIPLNQKVPTRYTDCKFYDMCLTNISKSNSSITFSCKNCERYTPVSLDIMFFVKNNDTFSETRY